MKVNQVTTSFVIENTELENYSFNLVHYFLDRQGYSIFNFEEKILENFSHDYYNIVFIYSAPLYNDVNIETLLEKVSIIKHKLKKQFFLFNARILVLATNSNINCDMIETVNNVDIIDASNVDKLYHNEIIKEVFPDLFTYPIHLSFEQLTYEINEMSLVYAKKIASIFNKKNYFGNVLLAVMIIIPYLIMGPYPYIKNYIIMSVEAIRKYMLYTLFTNSLYDENIISIGISLFLLTTFGIRIEKVYGSLRYILILLITSVFTNAFVFAFYYDRVSVLGFAPVVYGLLGSFVYVIISFRRFLAQSVKRILYFNFLIITVFLVFGDLVQLFALLGAIFSGFVSGFVFGIPGVKNGDRNHRITAFVLLIILIVLCVLNGIR